MKRQPIKRSGKRRLIGVTIEGDPRAWLEKQARATSRSLAEVVRMTIINAWERAGSPNAQELLDRPGASA